ncbi:hypothetical protein L1049_003911 [Liquidambar formosana]|uniref:SWIM-type domain-containing protein n=1 Tax=Liquidambar formosana TaxID=63359 RepID=A0AAP0WV81_LIQFO
MESKHHRFILKSEEDEDNGYAGEENYSVGDVRVHRDNETDLLPKFCSHEKQVFLSAGWACGIRHVGQCFEGGVKDFRNTLRKYSIEIGFLYKFIKNTIKKVNARCKMHEVNGCMWHVHARIKKANDYSYITRLNNIHSYGATIRTSKNTRISYELVSTLIQDKIHDRPLTRPADVVFDLKKDYGLDIMYHHAWWGIDRANNDIFGDQSLSFDMLHWYKEQVMKTNPGSFVEIDYDTNSRRFKRVFVAFSACIHGFNHCRPMLFLNGTFLKARYKGNLLATTAKYENQEFEFRLKELKKEGGAKVIKFLSKLPNENWTNAHFMGQRYGEMWSNAAESFNSQIRNARHLPITNMDVRLGNVLKEERSWVVSVLGDDIFEVHSHPLVSVDIRRRTCSCCQWQCNGFPCAHAVAVIHKYGRNLNEYVEMYFHVDSF